MDQSKSVTSPLVSSSKDVGDPRNDEPFNEHVYRKLIGSLLYLSTNTRPDIAFAVSYLSQFCSKPSQKNWVEAKRVLRYLNGTVDFKLTYVRGGRPIEIFCDADWANNADRKSFSGFVTRLAGAAVTWQTRKQRVVALSTVEAEYVSMCEAAKEVAWIRNFLTEINAVRFIEKPCLIKVDNQGAICLSERNAISERTKHVDLKYHYLKNEVNQGLIKFCYVKSEENVADVFTKPLGGNKLAVFNPLLGLT